MLTRRTIRAALLVAVLFARGFLPDAKGESCLSPLEDGATASAGYELLAGWPVADLQLLVDEYAYGHNFSRHQDAFGAGFAPGDIAYGETLEPGGSFKRGAVRSWKKTYAETRRKDYVRRIQPLLRGITLDRTLIETAMHSCLRFPGWSKLTAKDNCRFAFSAGLREVSAGMPVSPLRLSVVGGRCSAWPSRPLRIAGQSVECERSGNGSVTVTLETTRGQPLRAMLPPLRVRKAPEEPVLEERVQSQLEVVSLYRSRDYRVVEHGRSCPTCRLYAADIRPSVPGATIVSIGVVSSGGSPGWVRCPGSLRCGTPEFSPPDQRNVSGCIGQSSCRVWRLGEDEGQAYDTIQITFEAKRSICRNCPDGLTYDEARKRWEEARAEAANACEVFPDPPPQVLTNAARQ